MLLRACVPRSSLIVSKTLSISLSICLCLSLLLLLSSPSFILLLSSLNSMSSVTLIPLKFSLALSLDVTVVSPILPCSLNDISASIHSRFVSHLSARVLASPFALFPLCLAHDHPFLSTTISHVHVRMHTFFINIYCTILQSFNKILYRILSISMMMRSPLPPISIVELLFLTGTFVSRLRSATQEPCSFLWGLAVLMRSLDPTVTMMICLPIVPQVSRLSMDFSLQLWMTTTQDMVQSTTMKILLA